jgi:hypothetical protein
MSLLSSLQGRQMSADAPVRSLALGLFQHLDLLLFELLSPTESHATVRYLSLSLEMSSYCIPDRRASHSRCSYRYIVISEPTLPVHMLPHRWNQEISRSLASGRSPAQDWCRPIALWPISSIFKRDSMCLGTVYHIHKPFWILASIISNSSIFYKTHVLSYQQRLFRPLVSNISQSELRVSATSQSLSEISYLPYCSYLVHISYILSLAHVSPTSHNLYRSELNLQANL